MIPHYLALCSPLELLVSLITFTDNNMSDLQPRQHSCDNSPPSSPAQSSLTILPSDTVSSTGIGRNTHDHGLLTVDPVLLHLGEVRQLEARSNPFLSRPQSTDTESAISTISELTDAPSSLLTPTLESNTGAHSNLSTIPDHFLATKKIRKSWVWGSAHGEEYLEGGKWRWRCQHCMLPVLYLLRS